MSCIICDGPGSEIARVRACVHQGLTYRWNELRPNGHTVFHSIPHRKITTRNEQLEVTGYVVPIFNVHEGWPGPRPDQVYLTVVAPGKIKGPHLHKVRHGVFTCVSGNVVIVTRKDGVYKEHFSGVDFAYTSVPIPPGVAAAIYNPTEADALVLNMPSPAWRVDDQDEWPVEDWNFTRETVEHLRR